jgi:signal transduction histidine kinase
MRMPPGWDGLQTIEQLWKVDPGLQVVICSAYSDYDWDEVLRRLNRPDNLLVVKKPFEAVEVLQCANTLTGKWHSERALRQHLAALENTIRVRTASVVLVNEQLREQMRLREAAEVELGLVQKLESVGRLAAGIAHEINTPIQYISDSVHFLGAAFEDLLAVVTTLQQGQAPSAEIDLAFLREEVPRSIARTVEGTRRVASIVGAMREFAHPDGSEKTPSDLNRALETTLQIARNEYKYVALIEFDRGEIPEVVCNVGELSQVFLNLIVNAAHAVADAGRNAESGRIAIRSRLEGDSVELSFEDNGCGIPKEIIDKIYDPFFTTKEVGRGSGQGLAIARSIVVDKHAGRISVASTPGAGTTFTLRIPVAPGTAGAP